MCLSFFNHSNGGNNSANYIKVFCRWERKLQGVERIRNRWERSCRQVPVNVWDEQCFSGSFRATHISIPLGACLTCISQGPFLDFFPSGAWGSRFMLNWHPGNSDAHWNFRILGSSLCEVCGCVFTVALSEKHYSGSIKNLSSPSRLTPHTQLVFLITHVASNLCKNGSYIPNPEICVCFWFLLAGKENSDRWPTNDVKLWPDVLKVQGPI